MERMVKLKGAVEVQTEQIDKEDTDENQQEIEDASDDGRLQTVGQVPEDSLAIAGNPLEQQMNTTEPILKAHN